MINDYLVIIKLQTSRCLLSFLHLFTRLFKSLVKYELKRNSYMYSINFGIKWALIFLDQAAGGGGVHKEEVVILQIFLARSLIKIQFCLNRKLFGCPYISCPVKKILKIVHDLLWGHPPGLILLRSNETICV